MDLLELFEKLHGMWIEGREPDVPYCVRLSSEDRQRIIEALMAVQTRDGEYEC